MAWLGRVDPVAVMAWPESSPTEFVRPFFNS
jgi:hypothetical protein